MIRSIFSFCIPLFLFSCTEDKPGVNKQLSPVVERKAEGTQVRNDSLVVQDFDLDYSGIDGCSALFRENGPTINYVFASDRSGKAVMRIANRKISLSLVLDKSNESTIHELYKGGGYEVEIRAGFIQQTGDEVSAYKGTVEVKKGTSRKMIAVSGEVGC